MIGSGKTVKTLSVDFDKIPTIFRQLIKGASKRHPLKFSAGPCFPTPLTPTVITLS